MKVKNAIKKIGAAAASTLMVGMTMGSAASLADFPGLFLDDDGTPTSQIVVGESAKTADVVGAINVAAALGQSTIQTEEKTESQTVSVQGAAGWSASDGETLSTRNSDLFFGDALDKERDTLTDEHFTELAETTFRDDSGDTTDIEYFLNPGNNSVQFDQPDDRNNEDPILFLDNVESVGPADHLFSIEANMEDEIAFNSSDVESEEIKLFGKTYDVLTDTTDTELVLSTGKEEVDLETGESTTLTVDGTEFTIEATAVTDSTTAAFKVNGNLEEEDEDSTFTVGDTEFRLEDVIQTNSQNSEGVITISVGHEELHLQDGDTIEDGDGDDIEGTFVQMSGSGFGGSGGVVSGLSNLEIFLGSEDDDREYIMAGESWAHDTFENYVFHYGGLAPDVTAEESDATEIAFTTSGDDTVTVGFTGAGEDSSSTVEFLHDQDTEDGNSDDDILADDDADSIIVEEGAAVEEDDYFVSDAGDFSHMWEVTNIDRDETGTNIGSGDEATIDLKDAVTGDTQEVDLDATAGNDGTFGQNNDYYAGTEIIDGKSYHFVLEGGTNDNQEFDTDDNTDLAVAWGDGSSVSSSGNNDGSIGSNLNTGNELSLYAAVDGDSEAAVAFTEQVLVEDDTAENQTLTYELPSTESTDAKTVDVNYSNPGGGTLDVDIGNDGSDELNLADGGQGNATFTVGQTLYNLNVSDAAPTQGTFDARIGVDADQTDNAGNPVAGPGALVVEPEDDNDEEHAYFVDATTDTNDNEIDVSDAVYTGSTRETATLESDDDVTAGYDFYGAYSEFNSDNQQTFTLWLPDEQSVAGAAFTDQQGALNAGGGSSSATAEVTYTGVANTALQGALPDVAMLDSEVTDSVRSSSDLILVGGPAVNTLVADLAADGKTWSMDQWRNQHQGEALIQLVENAFSQGNHAMIVAGWTADDTRSAARYVSNYADHQDELSNSSQVVLTSQQMSGSQ